MAILIRRSLQQLLLVSAVAAAFAIQAQANYLISYPNFSSTTGLTFAGNATTTTTGDGVVLRLTTATTGEAGAAYSTSPVSLGPGGVFNTTFQFRFTDASTTTGPADGITFVLAQSPTGLGGLGGGLGYGGVSNSIAIEFDTYNNSGTDISSNHVAIDTGGSLTNTDPVNVYGIGNCDFGSNNQSGCMSNGDLWSVTIGYDGANLSVSVRDPTQAASSVIYASRPTDIPSFLGGTSAYVGFTSGTGAAYENHDIISWQFDPTPPGVPEPATLATLFGGLAALAFVKRRR